VVLSGFLRIVTNQRIFDPATPMDTALAFCQRLVDWPRASLITPSRRHWELFTGLCRDIKGPLVTDAVDVRRPGDRATAADDHFRHRLRISAAGRRHDVVLHDQLS
jgi:hypothetical protein